MPFDFQEFLQQVTRFIPNEIDTNYGKVVKGINIAQIAYQEYAQYKQEKSIIAMDNIANRFLRAILFSPLLKPILTLEKKDKIGTSGIQVTFSHLDSIGDFLYEANVTHGNDFNHKIDKDFNYRNLGEYFYSVLGSKIFIDSNPLKKNEERDIVIDFSPIVQSNRILQMKQHSIANKVLEKPGTYLFFCPPGTGKSTFIFSDALKDKRCIKMLASTFMEIDVAGFRSMVDIFQPEVLLIEEIDKTIFNLSKLLLLLERIRSSNTTIVITANKVSELDESLIRAGRIDKIVKFDYPTKEDVTLLTEHFSTAKSLEENSKFVELMMKHRFSHSYIIDFAKNLHEGLESLENYISLLNEIKEENDKK